MDEYRKGKGKYVPLEVREKDIDYQRHRLKLFRDLLAKLSQCNESVGSASTTLQYHSSGSIITREGSAKRKYDPKREALIREIAKQAAIDIPPVLRGDIWCVILGICEKTEEEIQRIYNSIDKVCFPCLFQFIFLTNTLLTISLQNQESEGPADRQIELDIPRCHQYHPMLSSPEGHRKFRRILKAWVKANINFVYWQGMQAN